VAHLYFLQPHKPTQKNPKEPPSLRTKTRQTMNETTTTERRAACNSTYPKGGVSCFEDTFVQAESSILRMKFSAKNPALRVAANRSLQLTQMAADGF
jgi:hypothetical protein